jgi:hypothetical protein
LLNRNQFDQVVIGGDYLSIIISNILLARGKDTLLVFDESFKEQGAWTRFISDLELNTLQHAGHFYGLHSLINIQDYVENMSLDFCLDHLRIRLGRSVAENIHELLRKLPIKISDLDLSNVDEEYADYIKRLSRDIFQFGDIYRLGEQIFVDAPLFIKKIVNEIVSILNESAKDSFEVSIIRQTLFLNQTTYQSFINDGHSLLTVWWSLVSLIGRNYQLDRMRLEFQLETEFKQRGGIIHKSSVKDWMIHNGQVQAFCLESYEGVIRPQKIIYASSLNLNCPFELNIKTRKYQSLKYHFKYPVDQFASNLQSIILSSSLKSLGTDYPCVIVAPQNESELYIWAIIPLRQGGKENFYQREAERVIYDHLKVIFPKLDESVFTYCTKFINSEWFWTEKFNYKGDLLVQPILGSKLKDAIHLVQIDSGKRLSAISYWGPERIHYRGMIDYLMEFRQQSELIQSK